MVLDDCNVCGGDNTSCMDCADVVNGDAIRDACGVCNGDGSSCSDCMLGAEVTMTTEENCCALSNQCVVAGEEGGPLTCKKESDLIPAPEGGMETHTKCSESTELAHTVRTTLGMSKADVLANIENLKTSVSNVCGAPTEDIEAKNIIEVSTRRRRLSASTSIDWEIRTTSASAKEDLAALTSGDSFEADLASDITENNPELGEVTVSAENIESYEGTEPAACADYADTDTTAITEACLCDGTNCAVGSVCTANTCVVPVKTEGCGDCSVTCGGGSQTCVEECYVLGVSADFGVCGGTPVETTKACNTENCTPADGGDEALDTGAMELTLLLAVFLLGLLF